MTFQVKYWWVAMPSQVTFQPGGSNPSPWLQAVSLLSVFKQGSQILYHLSYINRWEIALSTVMIVQDVWMKVHEGNAEVGEGNPTWWNEVSWNSSAYSRVFFFSAIITLIPRAVDCLLFAHCPSTCLDTDEENRRTTSEDDDTWHMGQWDLGETQEWKSATGASRWKT